MKYTDAQLQVALERGIDVPGRKVFLHGDVDEDTVATIVRGLYVLDKLSADPIELFVSSYGGNVDDTFALHDVTRTLRCPVHTVALGKCMSAAPLLVACGLHGERYAAENALFMLHDSQMEAEGRPSQLAAMAAVEKLRSRLFVDLLTKYARMPRRHWHHLAGSSVDRYFTAQQALEWGLVDAIWAEKP